MTKNWGMFFVCKAKGEDGKGNKPRLTRMRALSKLPSLHFYFSFILFSLFQIVPNYSIHRETYLIMSNIKYETELKDFPNIFSLKGKVVVVTGGSRGLGLHAASGYNSL